MTTPSPSPTARTALPRHLHDFVVEMAIAVHKRSIYPGTHPILQGAVEGVFARLSDLLLEQPELSIGVAERQLVIDGAGSDEDHPLLSEYAARLSDHQVGGVRFRAGVTRDELDAFLGAVAGSVDDVDDALGRRADVQSEHVTVYPVAFDRLGLLESEAPGARAGHEDATWRALAAAALQAAEGASTGEALDPRLIAAAIGAHGGDAAFDAGIIDRLSQMLEQLGALGSAAPAQQRLAVSQLIENIGTPALTRLLQAGGTERGVRAVRTANESLAARAVVELVRAASGSEAVPISSAMLRLLQKLTSQAQAPGARGGEAERVLRGSIQRLLDGWTLANPNPEMYERVLEAAASAPKRGADHRRDVAEPERLVDLAIETQVITSGTELALSRLSMREGLAAVLERLQGYEASPVRESLVDRLVNESSLREYLGQPMLDLPLLRHAVDRMKGRAIVPLISALETRSDADGAAVVELLVRLGWDVLEPLGRALAAAPPRMLRHYLAVFERLDAWPPQVDPKDYLSHPDAIVRREAIKFLLRSDATHDAAVMAALRDREVRTFSLGLSAVARHCPAPAGRLLMGRFAEADLTPDLRARMIRAVGASGVPEAGTWLRSMVVSRRWLVGSAKLRKPNPESLAAAAAIVHHLAGTPLASEVLALIESARVPEFRRAITRTPKGGA